MKYIKIYFNLDKSPVWGSAVDSLGDLGKNKINVTTYKPFKLIGKKDTLSTNADVELDSKLVKQETFDFFDKKLTKENINKFVNSNNNLENIISLGNVFNGKGSINVNFIVDYFKENPSKGDLLSLIVENGAFGIFGSCLSDKVVLELKEIYRKNNIDKIRKILNKYKLPNGESLDVNEIFNNNKCEPGLLWEKLEKLVDENGNKLSKERIKKIIVGVADIKKIDTKEDIVKNIFLGNEEKFNTYINEIKGVLGFVSCEKKEQIRIIKEKIKIMGIDDLNELQINNLHKLTLNYLKTDSIEDGLVDMIKKMKVAESKSMKDKKELEDFINGKIIEDDKSIFSKDGGLPKEFQDPILGDFYKKEYHEQKNAVDYINKHFLNDSRIPNLIKKGIKFLLSSLVDDGELSIGDIANKILSSKFSKFLSNGLLSKLKRISNNSREVNYFIKNNILFNTETIWLYNNDPNKLKDYNIPNLSVAPGTEGRNQITTRDKFIKILKEKNVEDINVRGLVDYFLKAKIQYGKDTYLSKIFDELGKEKFNELKTFFEKGIGSKEENEAKSVLKRFLNSNKDLIKLMSSFNDFEVKDKKSINKDIFLLKNTINKGFKGPLSAKISSYYEDIKNGNILGKSAEKTVNLISYVDSNSDISEHIGQLVLNTLNGQNINKDIASKMENDTKNRKKSLVVLRKIFKEHSINIKEIPNEVLDNFKKGFLTNPAEAAYQLTKYLIDKKNLTEKDGKEFMIDLLELIGEKGKKVASFVQNKIIPLFSKEILTEDDLKSLLSITPTDEFSKKILEMYKRVLKGKIKNNKRIDLLFDFCLGKEKDFQKLLKKVNGLKGISPEDLKVASKLTSQLTSLQEKVRKTSQELVKKQDFGSEHVSINDDYAKLLDNLAKINGFYTKEEKIKIYNEIYNSKDVSDGVKQEIQKTASNEGIKLGEYNENNFKSSVSEIKDLNTVENLELDYVKLGGVVKIQSPFMQEGIGDNEIEGKTMKDANEKLLLSYLNKIGFYQADSLFLGKDTKEIENMFGVDITKPLNIEEIKKFSLNLTSGLLYKLKDIKNLTSVQKKYIKKFEKSLIDNPDNFELYHDLILFLNDNIDLLIKTGCYDFTEHSLKLNGFLNKEKDEKYRKWLQEKELFEKLS